MSTNFICEISCIEIINTMTINICSYVFKIDANIYDALSWVPCSLVIYFQLCMHSSNYFIYLTSFFFNRELNSLQQH
jgi:hypothetical protein